GLFERLPVAIYRASPVGQIVEANSALAALLGYPDREQLHCVSLADLYADPESWERWQASLAAGRPELGQVARWRSGNGETVWLEERTRAIFDDQDHLLYYEGVLSDASQRKRPEETIYQQESSEMGLESPHLYDSDRLTRDRAEVLREAAEIVSAGLERDDVLRRCLEQLRGVLRFDTASVFIYNENMKHELVVGAGYDDEALTNREGARLLEKSPILAGMVKDLQPVVSPDVRKLPGWIWVSGATHVRSFIAVPLVARDKMIGALMVDHAEVGYFGPEDVHLVKAMAQTVAVAIENARLLKSQQEQLKLAQTLQAVGALLTTSLSLEEVYEHIFDLLAEVVTYDSVSVQLLDDGGRLQLVAGRGFPDLKRVQELIRTLSGRVLAKWELDEPFTTIPDTYQDDRWTVFPETKYIRSWVGATLRVKGQTIGFLNVDSARPNTYDNRLGETVAAFANQAAVAIENARLYEETRRRGREASILHQVALATATILDINELLTETTQIVAATLYPDIFGFLLWDEAAGQLRIHPSFHGLPPGEHERGIPLDQSIAGHVLRTGQPYLAPDVHQDPLYFQILSSSHSEIAVPLNVRGRVIGVINAESSRQAAFSENDLHFLKTLAWQVATAIERAQLYEAQRRYTAHLAMEVSQRTTALRSERDRMQAILDSAGEGIFFTDRAGTILYVNPAMTQITGYQAAELQQQAFLPDPTVPGMAELYEKVRVAIQDGRSWSGELMSRRKDGTLYDLNLTLAPIRSTAGEVAGFVGIHSDISRLKEVERLKSKFVSNVSHELRTPLTNIETYTALMERGKPERRDHYLKVLSHETKRLTRLLQDVLELSRLDAERVPLNLTPTDLQRPIRMLLSAFMPKAEAKGIRLEGDFPAVLPAALIDVHRIEQVITNLINNALAYTPEKGVVRVTAGLGNLDGQAMIWLKVADTGYGIDPADMPRLFERFFRSQAAQESGSPGTGLGLAICKEIVDRHQGKIELESELGQGTTVTVWLLAVEGEQYPLAPAKRTQTRRLG
ncbi:MAG: GAF domain-containing protein, partial [Chloroflexi bacterium]|nr:GAF domain-containing protein [Chloroflexota bacterium]